VLLVAVHTVDINWNSLPFELNTVMNYDKLQ